MGETYLKAGACIASCGSEFWEDDNGVGAGVPQCSPCVADCNNCNNNATCTTCKPSRYLTSTSTCVATCVENGGAQFGNDAGSCENCNAACERCTDNGAGDCTVCASGTFKESGLCVASCLDTFWEDPNGGVPTCNACDATCLWCQGSATTCTAFFGGFSDVTSHTAEEWLTRKFQELHVSKPLVVYHKGDDFKGYMFAEFPNPDDVQKITRFFDKKQSPKFQERKFGPRKTSQLRPVCLCPSFWDCVGG